MRLLNWFVPALALLVSSGAMAQPAYPDRPIRMIVPLAAASAVDVAARIANLAPELTANVLAAANGLLPRAVRTNRAVPGKALRGSLPAVVERAGTKAITEYNQEEIPIAAGNV